jgi:hypothetical protein
MNHKKKGIQLLKSLHRFPTSYEQHHSGHDHNDCDRPDDHEQQAVI